MDNNYNYSGFGHKYTKEEISNNDKGLSSQKEILERKKDEDLIIEENTIYEIDKDCVELLKRKRKRLV